MMLYSGSNPSVKVLNSLELAISSLFFLEQSIAA